MRRVTEEGLKTTYQQRKGVHLFVRKLLGLAFLQHHQTEPAFVQLRQLASTPELQRLMTYVDKNWIHSHNWSPQKWSVFRQDVRTENDCEGNYT